MPVDSRLIGVCVYCGGQPGTSDHVPSKILLDDPLPRDLPTVDACSACNASFSLDEEYLACFVECVLSGTADPGALSRNKIKRVLDRKASLAERIRSSARRDEAGLLIWTPEDERVQRVVVKLARGHAAYELSLPQLEDPFDVRIRPFVVMSESDQASFEDAGASGIMGWPEVGSRAFHRACGARPFADQPGPWVVVQEGRYRYAVHQSGGVSVQVVLSDYLACSVEWE